MGAKKRGRVVWSTTPTLVGSAVIEKILALSRPARRDTQCVGALEPVVVALAGSARRLAALAAGLRGEPAVLREGTLLGWHTAAAFACDFPLTIFVHRGKTSR